MNSLFGLKRPGRFQMATGRISSIIPPMHSEPTGLTSGSLLRAIARFSGPMLVSAMLQNAQTLIDLYWVGRLGPQAIAAVAMGGTVMMMIFPLFMGLSTGTVALVSRAIGSGQPAEAGRVAGQSLLLALLFGILSGGLGRLGAAPALGCLGAEAAIVTEGEAYLRILLLGSVTTYLLFTANSALQGAGNAWTPMLSMLAANAINIVLDPVLIFGFGPFPAMGIEGAALATVAAQAAAACISLRRLHYAEAKPRILANHWFPDWSLCRRILRIGIPGTGQMLSRSLMGAVMMNLVAGFGTIAVAAYGTGLRFHMILLMPAFALGAAAATLVGQNLGAGQPGRAHRAAWMATWIDMGLMLLSSLAVLLWAPQLMGFFTEDPAVIATGARYLRMVSPVYIFSSPGIILGRALNGAGDTLGPMFITIFSLWGLQVPAAILMTRWHPDRIDGVWFAIIAAMMVHGLAVIAWFETGRWKTRKV